MGFFKQFLRGAGKIIKGGVKGVQVATGAVSDGLNKVAELKNSNFGKMVMLALMANPKTRSVAMKADEMLAKGQDLANLSKGLSRGQADAVNDVIQRASQGRIMGT